VGSYNVCIVKVPGRLEDAIAVPEGPKRTAAVAAWIQGLYETDPAVLVGGAAVELYTAGAYTTGDFDFVGTVPDSVARALSDAGFKREGRHWIRAEGEIFVEFPGSRIEKNERTAILNVSGTRVLTLTAEDMIVDRLAAWQFWRSTTDGASAFLIWKAQARRLDSARLTELAERRGIQKALASLRAFLGRGPRRKSPEDLERWASSPP
jgi:hypothetical protein